jgi:argininosuccinate synthase
LDTQNKIRSLEDLSLVARTSKRVLTLFSGGLDSTYVLKELAQYRDCEIVALTVDMGDGVNREDLAELAQQFGARSVVIDGQKTFAQDAVLPAIRANARYMSIYPISSSLSRPIISRYAVELADKLECDAIVHTANQSQNSLRRLNGAIGQMGFKGFYGSPYEFSALSREEKIEQLRQTGLNRFQARGTSGDSNLWCREFESGSLDNPEAFWTPESLFEWTAEQRVRSFDNNIRIEFYQGIPVALDGIEMPLVELIAQLNKKAGSFQIGRYSGLEHLDQGEKVLEVREAPAACLLMDAYRHLETATLDAELLREKLALEQIWVREAIEGRWYGELRIAVDSFISQTARHVSGMISYQLRQGAFDVCSITAENPLYLTDRDDWEKKVAGMRGRRNLIESDVRGRKTNKSRARDFFETIVS